jgi:hypothetical protein
MTITNQDITIYRGDSALLNITLTDVNGQPFTLGPGGTVRYRMANTSHSGLADTHIIKELNAGVMLSAGVASVSILSEETDLPPDSYYHELKIYDGGDVATAMTGNFQIRPAMQLPHVLLAAVAIPLGGNVKL